MSRYENIINNAIKTVMENSVCEFDKWFMDDFETDVYFESETDLKELSDDDYGYAQSDWVAWVINGFVARTCEELGINCEYTDETINKQRLIEEIYEDVKDELFKRTSK